MRQFVLVETFREVCIRLDIGFLLQKQLDAYIRINEALALYLTQICNLSLFEFHLRIRVILDSYVIISTKHQKLISALHGKIYNYIESHNGNCEIIPAPFAVFLKDNDVMDRRTGL